MTIQSTWRAFAAKKKFDLDVRSIVILQALARKHVVSCAFRNRRQRAVYATTAVQTRWRSYVVRSRYIEARSACLRIQAVVRGRTTRSAYLRSHSSAQLIQATFRRYTYRKTYQAYHQSVILIQRRWRGYREILSFMAIRDAAVLLQSVTRRMLSRSELQKQRTSAINVQRLWRGFVASARYKAIRSCVVVIQGQVRRWIAANIATSRRHAILCLQKNVRRTLAQSTLITMKTERQREQLCREESTSLIQRAYRGYLVRRELHTLHSCATIIQTSFRCYLALVKYQLRRVDIIIAQSVVRRWLARREIIHCIESAVLLQSCFRRYLALLESSELRHARDERLRQLEASSIIKRAYRVYKHRLRSSEVIAATKIQSVWRCYITHMDFLLSVMAAMKIQIVARGYICRKERHESLAAVVKMQKFARFALTRTQLRRQHSSATLIQSIVRTRFVRAEYCLQKRATLLIQRTYRGFIVRLYFKVQNDAACNIQRIWRGYHAFAGFVDSILAAIGIQSAMRMKLAEIHANRMRMRIVALQMLHDKCATRIQKCLREYLYKKRTDRASRAIQSLMRVYLRKVAFMKLRIGVIAFQAVTRGCRVRRRRTKVIEKQALRVQRANVKAAKDPKLRLGYRTRSALRALLKMTRLSELHSAISTLEVATRLSEACCTAFADTGAPAVLFSLIRTCNRSLPHTELLHTILLTMYNVASYDYLLPSMATATGVEVFLDLVQMFRDKDGIFFLATTLLERVIRHDEEFQVRQLFISSSNCVFCSPSLIIHTYFVNTIQSICNSKENLKRLHGVFALSKRKLNLHSYKGTSATAASTRRLSSCIARRDSIAGSTTTAAAGGDASKHSHHKSGSTSELGEGLRALRRVILLVDSGATSNGGIGQRH